MIKKLSLLVAAVAVTGCVSQTVVSWPDRVNSPDGVYSRQIAFVPHSTQGIDVLPSKNWYYGQTQGIRAYAAEGGIVYVSDNPSSIADDINTHGAGLDGKNKGHKHKHMNKNRHKHGQSAGIEHHEGHEDHAHCEHGHDHSEHRAENEAGASNGVAGGSLEQGGAGTPAYFDQNVILGSLALSVSFPLNKTDSLYPESQEHLNAFVSDFDSSKERLVLIGYTDDIGLDDYNIPLSEKRANYIKSIILKAHPDAQITTIGSGPSPRIADNRIDGGRKDNRRVEIFILKEGVK